MPVSLPVGGQFKVYEPGTVHASYSFAYSDTDHYYVGKSRDRNIEDSVAPATRGMEHVLGLSYDLPHYVSLVAEIPFVDVEQSRKYGGVAGTMEAGGLSDMRLLARYWFVVSPGGGNLYGSFGLRLPTGESNGKFTAQNGSRVTKDLAAQEGTGNLAWIFELGGSSPVGNGFGIGFTGRYVLTPSETTVNNFRNELTGNGPEKNSDSDALTMRVSLSSPLSLGSGWLSKVSGQALLDFAWIPYDDIAGGSDGFRRSGPILAFGPGLTWSPIDSLSIAAAVPFTVYRDVQRNGGNVQEWMFQFSVSWDFDTSRTD